MTGPAWQTGIQLYAYDVNDEGPERVVEGASLAAAKTLLLCVSYSDDVMEIHSGRGGALPHNDRRDWHANEAYFEPTVARYPAGLVPPCSGDKSLEAEAAHAALSPLARASGMSVVPWVLLMSQRVADETCLSGVVNAQGERVPGWLCPSRPEVIEFAHALITDVIEKFAPPAIFIDRIRFPDWGPNGALDAFTCFCDVCCSQAASQGIDVGAVRHGLLAATELLKRDPLTAAHAASDTFDTGFRTLRAAASWGPVLSWLQFRHSAVERLVQGVQRVARGRTEIWLDVWPPTLGWLLGQDLSRLASYGVWTKPFTYHRWGGGSDVPGFIASMTQDMEARQALYVAFRRFFGFPGPDNFAEFAKRGLDPEFITTETTFARQLLGNHSQLAAGLQIWGMGRDGVHEALEHALRARPDGVFLYGYGWATFEEMAAAGEWLRHRGLVE